MNSLFEMALNMSPSVYGVLNFILGNIGFAVGVVFLVWSLAALDLSKKGGVKFIGKVLVIGLMVKGMMVSVELNQNLEKYSQQELEDLVLTPKLVLQKYDPTSKKTTQLGNAKLTAKENPIEKLGTISCGDLSFKECISDIKANKLKIVAELQEQQNVVQAN